MQNISVLLIEKNSFLREGIKSLLEKYSYDVVDEIGDLSNIHSLGGDQKYKLIIYGTHNDDSEDSYIKSLKAKFCNSKIVVLADELNSRFIKDSFCSGADGFILQDISARAFIGSLDLIMMGEKVFPTSMASILSDGWNGWCDKYQIDVLNDYDISARELDIIRCLANGFSNKSIARELNITEATVKVHLKAVLRKLGLENRTQIAIWAVSQGVVPCPEIVAHKREKIPSSIGSVH